MLASVSPSVVLRLAGAGETSALYAILLECSAWLRERGIAQWDPPYPLARYERDVALGRVRACESGGRIVGSVTVHEAAPDYYAADAWSDLPARYFSQLAIRRSEKRRGLGRHVIETIEGEARSRGVLELRIDIVPTNPFLRSYYAELGFSPVGESTIKGSAVLLMAKQIR
jgi:GNAT superfamily N-acetyltransferase